MSNILADAYKKALDHIHSIMQPIGSQVDPKDPMGLKKTTGGGAAGQDAIDNATGNSSAAKAD